MCRFTSGATTTAWWPLAWSSRMVSRMLSQWLPSMGTTSTFPASAHRPTHTQSRSPASTCRRSCSPRAISAQTRRNWLSAGPGQPVFVSLPCHRVTCKHWHVIGGQCALFNPYRISPCLFHHLCVHPRPHPLWEKVRLTVLFGDHSSSLSCSSKTQSKTVPVHSLELHLPLC